MAVSHLYQKRGKIGRFSAPFANPLRILRLEKGINRKGIRKGRKMKFIPLTVCL